jgi:hypothetical protein
MNRPLLACVLIVALVALPACDDGASVSSSSDAETDHVTTFSNKSIAGSRLTVDGTVSTVDDREGRIEINVAGALDKSGNDRASTPALRSMPSEITFTGSSMTYTLANGETRTVELSEAEKEMLQGAMEARRDTRAPRIEAGPRPATEGPQDLTPATIRDLEKRGFEVTDLGGKRYEIRQPSENGGVAVRSIYDANTGRLTEGTADLNEEPVVRVSPSAKTDGGAPTVQPIE